MHLLAYARRVDEALRSYLAGRDEPLILVANDPLRSIFQTVCSYENLIDGTPKGVAEESADLEIAEASRTLIDGLYAEQVADLVSTFRAKSSIRRATSKVTDIARSSTFGGVDTLLINMDASLPGLIDETEGTVEYDHTAGAGTYDVLSELACRTLLTGGRVLSVRQDDLPESEPVAALLRHPV